MSDARPDRSNDGRPPVAIGHVRHLVRDVGVSTEYLLKLGLRLIHQSDTFAVLELRGGTHLVLRLADEEIDPGAKAPFDLMVDDVEAARETYAGIGMHPSAIEDGRIHRWFHLVDPTGYEITVTSSHTSGRAV